MARPYDVGSASCTRLFEIGLEATGRISYEFAYHQLGGPGNAGMYSYFPIFFTDSDHRARLLLSLLVLDVSSGDWCARRHSRVVPVATRLAVEIRQRRIQL